MFEIDLKLLGAVLIGVAITVRPYIFKRLNVEGTLAHIVYFSLLMMITFPLYLYQPKFTFTSIDDKSAKELIARVLESPAFNGFTNIENVKWKPYNEDKNLYNIKAQISKQDKHYNIYLQPTCEFLEGCQVGVDKIMVFENGYKSYPVEKLTEDIFIKRDCRDLFVQESLEERIKFGIQTFAENLNKMPNVTLKYDIESLATNNHTISKETPLAVKTTPDYMLSNSCSADFELKSVFTIEGQTKKGLEAAFSVMYDDVKVDNDLYAISSKVNYDIYTKNGEVVVYAMPFNLKKMQKMKTDVETQLKEKKAVVKDEKTNLMWQNSDFTKQELESESQSKNYMKSGDFDYADKYCKSSTYAGFDNWRLPTKKEFKTIRDRSNEKNNYFKESFKHTYALTYWTSETDKRDALWGWGVSMAHEGEFYLLKKQHSSLILCVRNMKKS